MFVSPHSLPVRVHTHTLRNLNEYMPVSFHGNMKCFQINRHKVSTGLLWTPFALLVDCFDSPLCDDVRFEDDCWSLSSSGEMVRQARVLAQATSDLVNAMRSDAEAEVDIDNSKKLLAAAKLLADATARMVEAAKVTFFFFFHVNNGKRKKTHCVFVDTFSIELQTTDFGHVFTNFM